MSLTGILLDVSGSMKSNIGSGTDEEGAPWARSIFQVIDDLIKHDVSADDRVFAIGFGAGGRRQIFDIIATVKEINKPATRFKRASPDDVNDVLDVLERNGARNIRNWAKVDLIQSEVSDTMVALILMKLKSDPQFVWKFVNEFLPSACRDKIEQAEPNAIFNVVTFIPREALCSVENAVSKAIGTLRPATAEDIEEVIKKVERYLQDDNDAKYFILKDVGRHSTFRVQDASSIIRGCVGDDELTAERSRELLKNVEPYIYGGTPLFESLDKAIELFQKSTCEKKLLFVLSDGQPSDGCTSDNERLNKVVSKLEKEDVTVVSCFVTESTDIQPKRLYDQMPHNWEDGAKFLFSLSSKIKTQILPRAVLVQRGWDIDIANNETKLFVQINHPDNLREACDLAKDVAWSAEALSELLVSVDLDVCINQDTGNFKAKEQVGGTCYANASAAVLHLAMKRILGREGGYAEFDALKKEMIDMFGYEGANIEKVLQKMCPKYRLQWEEVGIKRAMEAIIEKRPVVAIFYLTKRCTCCGSDEWEEFSAFYRSYSTGILTEKELDLKKRCRKAPLGGHAVVLTSFNSQCLTLMNSWGDTWGDKGFFRVKNAGVLNLRFIDIYWTLNDLKREEIEYYNKHGSEVARTLMTKLKGLQKAEYECPRCNKMSLVTEFVGTMSEVECPKCCQSFSTQDGQGNILALNMYLMSLSR